MFIPTQQILARFEHCELTGGTCGMWMKTGGREEEKAKTTFWKSMHQDFWSTCALQQCEEYSPTPKMTSQATRLERPRMATETGRCD